MTDNLCKAYIAKKQQHNLYSVQQMDIAINVSREKGYV